MNYYYFASFNSVVDTMTSIIQMGPNILNIGRKSNTIIIFRLLRIPSLISKDQKENLICTMDDVRGDYVGPRHDTTPAAVIANKNKNEILKEQQKY